MQLPKIPPSLDDRLSNRVGFMNSQGLPGEVRQLESNCPDFYEWFKDQLLQVLLQKSAYPPSKPGTSHPPFYSIEVIWSSQCDKEGQIVTKESREIKCISFPEVDREMKKFKDDTTKLCAEVEDRGKPARIDLSTVCKLYSKQATVANHILQMVRKALSDLFKVESNSKQRPANLASGFFEQTFFRYWQLFDHISDMLELKDFQRNFQLTQFKNCYKGEPAELIFNPNKIDAELINLKEELKFCLSGRKEQVFRYLRTTGVFDYDEDKSDYNTNDPRVVQMRRRIFEQGIAMIQPIKPFIKEKSTEAVKKLFNKLIRMIFQETSYFFCNQKGKEINGHILFAMADVLKNLINLVLDDSLFKHLHEETEQKARDQLRGSLSSIEKIVDEYMQHEKQILSEHRENELKELFINFFSCSFEVAKELRRIEGSYDKWLKLFSHQLYGLEISIFNRLRESQEIKKVDYQRLRKSYEIDNKNDIWLMDFEENLIPRGL